MAAGGVPRLISQMTIPAPAPNTSGPSTAIARTINAPVLAAGGASCSTPGTSATPASQLLRDRR